MRRVVSSEVRGGDRAEGCGALFRKERAMRLEGERLQQQQQQGKPPSLHPCQPAPPHLARCCSGVRWLFRLLVDVKLRNATLRLSRLRRPG
ncbi:hypothetical protein LSTR_LSTR009411 [Laodelphax striatellus]|uniref:Uncharacterized protein n=1 Tax=Laodelphax striatellus TaxID=195883 RepID=A0A482WNE2_LAOST|nr:hypothetical protein LSTR_LSTR009411 [Laodelphax striatellus]